MDRPITDEPKQVAPPFEWIPILALVVTTAGWGLSFSLMRFWQNRPDPQVMFPGLVSGLVLIFLRMFCALVLFLMLQPKILSRMVPRDWLGGLAVGFPLWAGFALQLWGLEFTTPAKSAFFTSISSLWVPVILGMFGTAISQRVWLGFFIAAVGLLVLVEGGVGWGLGEGLTLIGSVAFAMQILALDRFGKSGDGNRITPGLFLTNFVCSGLVCLVLGLASANLEGLWDWTRERLNERDTLIGLALMVIFPTLLSYSLMNAFQPRVTPEKAAILYMLEPLFSLLFSYLLGLDLLHTSMVAGGLLVIAGVIVVETQGKGKS